MKAALLLFTLFISLASVPLSGSVFVPISDELPATLPLGPVYTATNTGGPWHLASTWVQGAVPGAGSVVTIPATATVRIEHFENTAANAPKWVRVLGRLEVSNTVSTRFHVETIHVAPSGTFALGTAAAPLPVHLLAEIIFTSDGPIVRTWDKEQISRGLVAEGPVKVYGASRGVAYLGVTADVVKNTQTTLATAGTAWNWQQNDEVVLTGTYFRRGRPSQEEVRRVNSVAFNSLTVDAPFSNDHLRVSTAGQAAPNLHVANLTRNVRFRSSSTAIGDRGHIILNHVDSEIQWAAFIHLGRTNKSVMLDDFIVGATSTTKQANPELVNNRRGRYSLHVHKAGWGNSLTTPQTKIIGCVVNNTPGWGFANHGSNVNFEQNVAYDFFGAGFVTEDGDELGKFTNNIAIKGRGTGEFDRKSRINFQHPRRQALADFGFMGDGFWFNGPAIRVNGAVANSCNGRGMIWHTTGAVRPSTATTTGTTPYPFGRYSFFPKNQISNVYSSTYPAAASLVPRTWKTTPNNAVIADLPILECTNVQGYANFIGFHLRFNNHDSNAWYGEDPFNYHLQIEPVPGQSISSVPTRVRENISNLKLWNNEEAYAIRYASFANWTTVQAINRLDYDEVTASNDPSIFPIYAAEDFFVLNDMTFNGLTIDGWDVANLLTQITNNANGVAVTSTGTNIVVNSPLYRKYALTGTWDRRPNATPCALPTLNNTSVALNKQSATLSWNGSAGKYLIRYRIDGSQQWTYEETPASTKSLGIVTTPGRNYSWQVMGGCTNTLSNWTARGTFNTF